MAVLDFEFSLMSVRARAAKVLLLTLLSGSVALLFYIPLFLHFGLGFLTFNNDLSGEGAGQIFNRITENIFGQIGRTVMAVAVVAALYRWRRADRHGATAKIFAYWAIVAVIYLLLFVRLPSEPAYLLPLLPGLYTWLGLLLPFLWQPAIAVLLALSCFVQIDRHKLLAQPCGTEAFVRGKVLVDQAYQRSLACVAGKVGDVLRADATTYVVAGFFAPMLRVRLEDALVRRVIYSMTDAELAAAGADKRDVTQRFVTIDSSQAYVLHVSARPFDIAAVISTASCIE